MKKDNRNACAVKTSIGGQALMEGIMMRGPKKTAMAVWNTKGEMIVEEIEPKATNRPGICKWPLVRGIFGFIDSMALGYKCLMRSAEISGLDDVVEESPKKKKKREEKEAKAAAERAENAAETVASADAVADASQESAEPAQAENGDKKEEEEKLPSWVMTLTMVASVVIAVALAIGLFFYLPSKLYELLARFVPFFRGENAALNSLWKSLFEGIFKILLLVGYMAAISLMKDIRRTFMYHGAEHKTIFCYEAGLELTVENVRLQKRFHPRCGTSFLILMLLVSMFISFLIDPLSIAIGGKVLQTGWRTLVRLLLFPLVMGIGYELIKFAGRHDNLFTRIISAPGVWLQHLTVFEPDDRMIECAITAVKRVIPEDGSDKW